MTLMHCSCSRNLSNSSETIFRVHCIEAPVEGQFDHDNDDLGQDPYDLLKTLRDMPVLDKSITPTQDDTPDDMPMSNVVAEEENRLLDDKVDNISISSSQGRRHPANFTSLTYRQKELSSLRDFAEFRTVSCTPGTTLRTMPHTMPTVSPKATPQARLNDPHPGCCPLGDIRGVAEPSLHPDEDEDSFSVMFPEYGIARRHCEYHILGHQHAMLQQQPVAFRAQSSNLRTPSSTLPAE